MSNFSVRTPWYATLSGFSGSLVGIGLARFAYTPLLPAIIAAGWFDPADAAYLGAANLTGYLTGALFGGRMAAKFGTVAILRTMMLATSIAFFACGWPLDFAWFFLWRFVSGVSGGAIMVLAATSILPHVPPSRRGFASGAIFMGIGFGIAASGTLVPLLLRQGLTEAWIGLGVLSLLLTAVSWKGWPQQAAPHAPAHHPHPRRTHPSFTLRALYVGYGLQGLGLVPHMIFLVDYVARGRGEGLETGAFYWVLFGLGAIAGPLAGGLVADRIGFGATLRLTVALQAISVAVPVFAPNEIALMVSSIVVGASTPGVVAITLGRVHELLLHAPSQQKAAWSKATTSFAIMQAAAAYGMSYLFSRSGGDYAPLFMIASAALIVALLIDLAAAGLAARLRP